jgi:hypothetical protein
MYELDDVIKHYGKKGMKWGVRKKVTKAIKGHITKRNKKEKAKLEKYHEKKKNSARYKKLYNKTNSKKSHLARVREVRNYEKTLNTVIAANIGIHAGPAIAAGGAIVARKAHKIVTDPENIRRGKNLILAMKREKYRYANASKFKNGVNF